MVDASPLIPHRKKQGRRVLWIFDSRKAVISINFIGLVVYIILLTLELTTWRDLLEHLNIFWLSTNIVFYIIVMVSALIFKHYVVMVGILWAIADIIWFTVDVVGMREWFAQNIGTAYRTSVVVMCTIIYALHLLIIYSGSVFVAEVRKGIMSRETHTREKYCW